MAERRHEGDEVGGHRSLAVVSVLGVGAAALALAVAGQIRNDDGEVSGEERRDLVPGDVALRITVEKEERRSAAAAAHVEADASRCIADLDAQGLEAFEHGRTVAWPGARAARAAGGDPVV